MMIIGSNKGPEGSGFGKLCAGNDFQEKIIEGSKLKPTLALFTAANDPRLHAFARDLAGVIKHYGQSVNAFTLDVADGQTVALLQQLGGRGVPSVFYFNGGQPVDGFMGLMPVVEMQKFFTERLGEPVLNTDTAALDARRLYNDGQFEAAAALCLKILHNDPQHAATIGMMIECYLTLNQGEPLEAILQSLSEKQRMQPPIRSALDRLAFIQRLQSLQPAEVYEERLAADPHDAEAAVNIALLSAWHGNPDEAIEKLLELVAVEPLREAAASALNELFIASGTDSERSRNGRKRLSAALFR